MTTKTATEPTGLTAAWNQLKSVFIGPGSLTDFGQRYLLLDSRYQTSVKGIYAIGDVAGTPDIKAALNAGFKVAQTISQLPKRTAAKTDYDVVIIGAGPAGLNAASELKKAGKSVLIIERKKVLQTIRAFANSKPLYLASTGEREVLGDFKFQDCLASECIADWDAVLEQKQLDVHTQENVVEIKHREAFEVWTQAGKKKESKKYLADRIIVAIGKPKLLDKVKLAGASDQRVRYQLRIDPDNSADLQDKSVLVIAHAGSYEGFEMALNLVNSAAGPKDVTLIYEEGGPEEISLELAAQISDAESANKLKYFKNSQLLAIHDKTVDILAEPRPNSVLDELLDDKANKALKPGSYDTKNVQSIANDIIFTGKIIDRDLPVTDLKQFGLNTERRMSWTSWTVFALLFLFFAFIYISKSSKVETLAQSSKFHWIGTAFKSLRTIIENIAGTIAGSALWTGVTAILLIGFGFSQIMRSRPLEADRHSTLDRNSFAAVGLSLATLCFYFFRHRAPGHALYDSIFWTWLFAGTIGGFGLTHIITTWQSGFGKGSKAGAGNKVDFALIAVMTGFLTLIAFGPLLIARANLRINGTPTLFLYQIWSLIYSSAIVIFGFKAIYRYRTHYRDAEQGHHQTRKLLTLMVFQVFFLCILPEVLLQNWRAYGLVLAWPLNLKPDSYAGFVEKSGQILHVYFPVEKSYSLNRLYFFWNIMLTLIVIPVLVWKGGMRYCTWICSCGGLAETVGDEWRQFSPKGPANTKRERLIYVVLAITLIIMVMEIFNYHFASQKQSFWGIFAGVTIAAVKGWSWIVDLAMCGIIPLVLYPFMSGRTWCRFACPTAGFMKLMSRKTTETGIQPDKKRCIACGMCDRYCEVGVPIRKHALKGTFFSANDTTCISCGVCISVCPTDTLRFDKHPNKRVLPMAV